MRVKVCDKLTGRVLREYGSVKEAAEDSGLTVNTIRSHIKRGNKCGSKTWLAWRRAEDEGPIAYYDKGKPVIAYDGETYAAFLGTTEAAAALDVNRTTLAKLINAKQPFEFRGRMVRACWVSESNPAYAAIRKYRRKGCFDE